MANSIQYDYKILDRYSAPLQKIARSTEKMRAAARKTSQAVKKMGARFKETASKMGNLQGAIAGVGAAAVIDKLVKDSFKMENAIADVGKVSDMSKDQLAGLRVKMEDLSEAIGRPAEGLARIAFEGKKLGTTDKELIPFVKTVAKMAVAFDMTEESAGAAIGSIRAKMGLSMEEIVKFGDSANHLANTMATSGENIIEIVQRTSGTMKTLKVPPEAAAGFAAFADQVEVSAELGASGMNMMLNRMMVMPGMMDKLLQDPVKAVRGQMAQLAKMPEAKRAKKIFKMFGQESGRFVLKLTSNMELFDKTMKTAMSKKALGSMEKEFTNHLDRSSTKYDQAVIMMKNSTTKLGDTMVPFILIAAKVISSFTKMTQQFATAHPILFKIVAVTLLALAAFTSLAAIVGVLLPIFAALSWPIAAGIAAIMGIVAAFAFWIKTGNPLINTLKNIGSAIGGITGAFLQMFGFSTDGTIFLEAIKMIFNGIAGVINMALKPVEFFLTALNNVIKVASVLSALGIGIGEALGFGGMEERVEKAGKHRRGAMGAVEGVSRGGRNAAQSSVASKTQDVNVGGTIVVAAEKGSQVISATPDLNTGVNMGHRR